MVAEKAEMKYKKVNGGKHFNIKINGREAAKFPKIVSTLKHKRQNVARQKLYLHIEIKIN